MLRRNLSPRQKRRIKLLILLRRLRAVKDQEQKP